jgi:hypothetical protein
MEKFFGFLHLLYTMFVNVCTYKYNIQPAQSTAFFAWKKTE